MSAEKRKFILLGFAGLAVVLVAVIAIVSPSFRSEDATGAIGAVQKHRAPQITKQDVILGGEQVRQQQKVLFGGYLNDAATLKAISRDLAGVKSNDVQSRIAMAERDLQTRFQQDFELAAVEMRKLADEEQLTLGAKKQAILGEIDEIVAAGHKAELKDEEMLALSNRLRAVADNELGVSRVSNIRLASDEVASLDGIRTKLSEFDVADLATNVRLSCDYLEAMAKESAVLADADNVAALNEADVQALGTKINGMAATLDAQAQANVRSELKAESDEIAALGRMSESLSKVDVRADVAAKTAYDACIRDLNRQMAAVNADLAAITMAQKSEYASMLSSDFVAEARTLADEVATLEHKHAK